MSERNLGEFVQFTQVARDKIPAGKVNWNDSPFAWMRSHGPRTKSKMGRNIVEAWLNARGITWNESDNGICHFVIPGLGRVVVQFAILGKEGAFEFSYLRGPGLGTDAIWMLGVEPLRVRLWGAKPSDIDLLPSYASDQPGYHHFNFTPDDPPEFLKLIETWGDPAML